MKKMMMIAAMMIAAISANAQNEVGQITLKPMVGINLATMTKMDDSKMRVGLAAGVEAEYGVAENFSVTAGVLYSMQGVKFSASEGGVSIDETLKLDYINIPILANYYIIPGLAIKAGIQPAFKASAKVKAEASYQGESASDTEDLDGAKGFYLSIPVGLSYEYQSFVLDARYNLGVTKAFDGGDSKHSWFMFTLGYKFAL
ncbi:MAG: PorT family protein [Prevotella sp.]|nr:PorT family protein [Prevotella sp.]